MPDSHAVPSVKGSLYQAVAQELLQALDGGELTRDQVESRLEPGDVARIDGEIAMASWYPIDSYARLLRLLCGLRGGGRRDWYVQGGRQSAERLVALGVYAQLDDHTADAWESRVGRSLLSIAPALFNFGKWGWSGLDTDQNFTISVEDSAEMPEEVALRAYGFVSFVVERAAGERLKVAVDFQRIGSRIEFPVRVRVQL
jgi:hypothetical protein